MLVGNFKFLPHVHTHANLRKSVGFKKKIFFNSQHFPFILTASTMFNGSFELVSSFRSPSLIKLSVHFDFYIRTSNFLAEAEPELNVLIFFGNLNLKRS